MDEVALGRRIGALLRTEREKRGFTQVRLARRADTSQQCVSRVEAGTFAATTALVERLFEALDLQLRVDVEDRDGDLDASIEATSAGQSPRGFDLDEMLRCLDRTVDGLGEVPYVVDGRVAAMVQGLPTVTDRLELALRESDLDAIADWIRDKWNWLRWVEQWREYAPVDANPRRPGPLRYRTPFCDVRLSLAAELPAALPIVVGERVVRVRPLAEIEADDPQVGRLARRWRTLATKGGADR